MRVRALALGGVIQSFPATSAEWRGGKTVERPVTATVDQTLR